MDYVPVIVINSTGSSRVKALLNPENGMIKFPGELIVYSHIIAEIAKGKTIEQEMMYQAPIPKPEVVEPIVKEIVQTKAKSKKKK